MPETYTTDFERISDGSQTSYTPQQLVQKSAQIEVLDAEAQWRGVSTTSTNTDTKTVQNSGSAQATIETVEDTNTNSRSGTTTGSTEINRDHRTATASNSGQYGIDSGSLFTRIPSIPELNDDDVTVVFDEIEVDYFVEETNGGTDENIIVEWDDDPYNAVNYDSQTTLDISGFEKKRVGGFTFDINSVQQYISRLDGANIRYVKTGDTFGTTGLIAEITVSYTVETREEDIDREQIRVEYPPKRNNYNFDVHIIKKYIDGDLDSTTRSYTYKPNDTLVELSPSKSGSTKTIEIETRSTQRQTKSDTTLVKYPDTPDQYSVDEYTLNKFEDGSLINSDTVYEDKSGDTEAITSTDPSTTISLTIEGEFTETTINTKKTTNPSIGGEYLPDGLNTDTVVFLMDTSGSANQTKQQDIARQILSQLSDRTSAALLEFDFNTETIIQQNTLSNIRDELRDGINSLDSSGGTEIGQALLAANNSFDGKDGTIVLITDGESSDDPTDEAQQVANDGRQILSVKVGGGDTSLMKSLATITDGSYFDNAVNTAIIGSVLSDGELSEWKSLSNFDRTTQTLDHFIDGSELADFRIRFTWVFATPQPVHGSVGFRDNSAGVWREAAVAEESDELLQYTHVQAYNDSTDEWGVLDVVDASHEAAIESHQFYDEDAGWLAPREYQTA
jgi:hypothetical protein